MDKKTFVDKWSKIQAKESAAAQTHFNDVCALVGHPPPLEADPDQEFFTFEEATVKAGGQKGFADAYYRGRFVWEYKGPHADLDKAYQQLLRYKDALGNPPLLITSDTHKIIIRTNFTNTVTEVHEIGFNRILDADGVEILRRAFFDPESFRPDTTVEQITKATADAFLLAAEALQGWARAEGRPLEREKVSHFFARLLFCLFAEDIGLLPDNVFTQLIRQSKDDFPRFVGSLRNLFNTMQSGGLFGFYELPNFDGGLFDDDYVPDLPADIANKLFTASLQDWSGVDPAIFGTLFERVIDEAKRAQLGTHYTGEDDILLIVEPVLMRPLRRNWEECRQEARGLLRQEKRAEALARLQAFADELAAVKVLDPACGSGNFLYVSLQQLLSLQKEVIVYAQRNELGHIPLTVSPAQLYGIEINPYAHELAQITVWIGYIQWRYANGFEEFREPILRPLRNIERKDALIAYADAGKPEPARWPAADVAIGNPPFLGGKRMRTELGSGYVDTLFATYPGRVSREADLVCYWFEQARHFIAEGALDRAGLLATNSIRGGANRDVLEKIKETGDIFMAWSDRPWIQDGAAVRVSMVGFDDGSEREKVLDGRPVPAINPDLTGAVDLTVAQRLDENQALSFMGDTKGGEFDINAEKAQNMLAAENESGRQNSDVIVPWINGSDITRRPRGMYIIDFGVDMAESEAALYERPYQYVQNEIKPKREKSRRAAYRERWWIHMEPRPAMRKALDPLSRYIVTPRVAKHRLFVWKECDVIPDSATIAIACEDDYFFGVLHSKVHELWSLRQGSSLEDRPRYTPTTTFETFPFPWPPGTEPDENDDERMRAIAQAARDLVAFRQAWLHPPVPDDNAIDVAYEKQLKHRTLTTLYNALDYYREHIKGNPVPDRDAWRREVNHTLTVDKIRDLDDIHQDLDRAVLAAYGWPGTLGDDAILERLLALNLERARQ